MAETIFLVDGMYLLFSSFYSNRNMRTLKGEPTGAVYGFVTRIESIIRDVKPQRIAVAFDSKGKTFRHDMYEPYKAKRLVPPEELVVQIPLVKEYMSLRGIPLFEQPGFEADDIIAKCARSEAAGGSEVQIFSADKDLFQLVGDNIYIYHPKLKHKLDAAGIKEKFGVYPGQVVDFLSLMGDSSDNIPGVPGVGEKTALKIIEKYQDLDNLLDNLDEADPKIKKKIESNLDALEISRKLIDFNQIPEMPETFTPLPFENIINEELLDFYRRLSFNSLLRRFEDTPKTEAKTKSESVTFDITYEIIKTTEGLRRIKERILKEKYFAYDLETTALEFFKADILGISISFKDGGYYIPVNVSPNQPGAEDVAIGFDDFRNELAPVFEDPGIKKTGHNLKFDIIHLKPHGIEVNGVADDSMLMSYLIHPNRRAHNLKDLSFEVLNYRQTEYAQLTGKGKDQRKLIEVDLAELGKYCIDDSFLTLKLVDILGNDLSEKELEKLYRDIEMPLVKILMEMEYTGVKVDIVFLEKAAQSMRDRIAAIEKEIYGMAGYEFNLNSSQQLGELLFEKMNLPVKKRTRKTKSYSTDNEVLSELKGYPVVARLIEYRTYKKLLSTYLEGLMESVDDNHRVHGSFNQTVTATGRLSSSNPNLQNIPVGETAGIVVRDAFRAEVGKRLLAADYSQVELRVMAHFSQDPGLMNAFAKDFDIHQHTADTVFSNDLFTNAKEKRKRAKIINFSVLYGTGPFSLSKELGVSYNDAKNFIDTYFEKHGGVKTFIDQTIMAAEQDTFVKTISGRRRDIPEIQSANRTVKENGKRMAINTVIQGSAADIIKIAMINIHKKMTEAGMKSKLVMQVHDELVFEYPPEEEKQLLQLVKQEMETAVELRVPLKVDLETGLTWGSLQKISP